MDDFCWGLEKQSSTLGEMRIASMATTSTFSISPLFGFGDGNVYVWSIRSGKEVVVLDFSKVNIIQLMHNKFMNQLQAKTLLKGYLRELRQLYKRTKIQTCSESALLQRGKLVMEVALCLRRRFRR
ncbi:uncharacterized protein LOC133824558 isoform X5 [Humulus lupulus]|uniref:uncharacterized protein LOC133824558 isoform X5 n=1 Tax=Humulus lupulus TaxID=3486 RepID=UPI002B4050FF|nr:uncharacterized protein LOC133824558 isoform X5 [Humulus lupulus]